MANHSQPKREVKGSNKFFFPVVSCTGLKKWDNCFATQNKSTSKMGFLEEDSKSKLH